MKTPAPQPSPNPEGARRYFVSRAASYQADSQRWPWSWLRGREAAAVLGLMTDPAGQVFLELGSGAGFYTRLLLARGASHVFAVDFCQAMLEGLPGQGVTPILADVAQVEPGRQFERLVCLGLLEFVEDPARVLANARRLARPGAELCLLAPLDNLWGRFYRRFHRGHGVAVHLFTPASLGQACRQTGWRVTGHDRCLPFGLIMTCKAE